MKRIIAWVLVLSWVPVLAGCGADRSKRKIFNLVEDHYDRIVQACQEKDADALYQIDGITQVAIADGYVLVYFDGAGIATSSQDYGFYYSEENRPVAVDCNLDILCDTEDLTPEGKGFQFVDAWYNIFYTECIKGNIYFYSTYY